MEDATIVNTVLGMAELSDWCYRQTVSHAVYQGKDYYPCSTSWKDRSPDLPNREWDPDVKCHGYWSCTSTSGDEGDPDDGNTRYCAKVVPDPEHPEAVTYVFDGQAPLLYKGKPKIRFDHDILLINTLGENRDHRGSNHSNLHLQCDGEWTIPAGTHDVHTVLEGFWRIKYNKYDGQYEAFFPFSWKGYDQATLDPHDLEEIAFRIVFHGTRCNITPLVDHGS